jgi:hypothetical protein
MPGSSLLGPASLQCTCAGLPTWYSVSRNSRNYDRAGRYTAPRKRARHPTPQSSCFDQILRRHFVAVRLGAAPGARLGLKTLRRTVPSPAPPALRTRRLSPAAEPGGGPATARGSPPCRSRFPRNWPLLPSQTDDLRGKVIDTPLLAGKGDRQAGTSWGVIGRPVLAGKRDRQVAHPQPASSSTDRVWAWRRSPRHGALRPCETFPTALLSAATRRTRVARPSGPRETAAPSAARVVRRFRAIPRRSTRSRARCVPCLHRQRH